MTDFSPQRSASSDAQTPSFEELDIHAGLDDRRNHLRHALRCLQGKNVGHGSTGYNLLIGEPFVVSRQQYESICASGPKLLRLLATANRIYAEQGSEWNFISDVVEGGLTEDALRYQSIQFEKLGVPKAPMFFRADMANLSACLELNIPGGGLSLMDTMAATSERRERFGSGIAKGWAETLKEVTAQDTPRIAIYVCNPLERRNCAKFAEMLRAHGVAAVLFSDVFPEPKNVDVVVRGHLNSCVRSKGWDRIWSAYVAGDLLLEPQPSSIFEGKTAEILAYHPSTAHHFSEEIRALFPPTYLVEDDLRLSIASGNGDCRMVPVQDLPACSERERRFVIKYAGCRIALAGGGVGVFKLDRRNGEYAASKLIGTALEDWDTYGEPWLIQPQLSETFQVRYLDKQSQFACDRMRARITPYFSSADGEQTRLIGGSALFSKDWKVHGQSDSVHCPIAVRG